MSNERPVECVTTSGVQPGLVAPPRSEDPQHITRIWARLDAMIAANLARIAFDDRTMTSGADLEAARHARWRTWIDRDMAYAPDGSMLGLTWLLKVSIVDGCPPASKTVVDELPSFIDGVEIVHVPWSEAKDAQGHSLKELTNATL
jgi:hypothetical protein